MKARVSELPALGGFVEIFVPYYGNARLFTAATQSVGEVLLVLREPTEELEIPLDQAWSSTALYASFVYSATGLGVTEATANLFVDAVRALLEKHYIKRGVIWAADGLEHACVLGLAERATSTLTQLKVP